MDNKKVFKPNPDKRYFDRLSNTYYRHYNGETFWNSCCNRRKGAKPMETQTSDSDDDVMEQDSFEADPLVMAAILNSNSSHESAEHMFAESLHCVSELIDIVVTEEDKVTRGTQSAYPTPNRKSGEYMAVLRPQDHVIRLPGDMAPKMALTVTALIKKQTAEIHQLLGADTNTEEFQHMAEFLQSEAWKVE